MTTLTVIIEDSRGLSRYTLCRHSYTLFSTRPDGAKFRGQVVSGTDGTFLRSLSHRARRIISNTGTRA